MQLTIPAPNDDIDLSVESEQDIVQKARISAQLAGYKSVRHFTIAALLGIVKQNPLPQPVGQHPTSKKQ